MISIFKTGISSLLFTITFALTPFEVWPAGRTASISTSTSGYVSHYCTTEGYYLSSTTWWRDLSSASRWSGMQLTFANEFGSGANIVDTYFSQDSGYSAYTQTNLSTNVITKVQVCTTTSGSNNNVVCEIVFYYSDDTKTRDNFSTCACATSFYIPDTGSLPGKFLGFAYVNISSGGQPRISSENITVWVDSAPCSITKISAVTISNMTLQVQGAAVTRDLTTTNTVAVANSDPIYCGTYSYSFSPSLTFITISGMTLSGQSTDVANVGTYSMTLTIQIGQWTHSTAFFTLTVTCTAVAPSVTASTITVEIGVNAQPYSIAFTQSLSCGVSATMTSTPTPLTWLSLASSTTSGGTIQISGATLTHVGTYTLNLMNTYLSQTPTTTLTLILKDPCSRAVFVTSTSPFSNITISTPSTTNTVTNFHVYTDVENAYPALVCGYTATFTTSYAPLSVSSPYTSHVFDPTWVVLPTDIGTHAVTILISSQSYPGSTTAVSFDFDIIVTCTVTSLSISTTATDFSYTLNSGTVTKGPFTPVQVSDCKFSPTYAAEIYQGGTFISSATNFDTTTLLYSFNFVNPSDVGTWTYLLRATIPQIDPDTGVNRKVEKTIVVTVVSDCINTTLIDKTLTSMTIKVSQGTTTQDVFFQDQIAQSHSSPSYCGARVITFTGGKPSYLFLNPAMTTLIVSTSNVADVGTHTVEITVSLANYSAIASITKTFQAIITCEVLTLTFTTSPANIFIEPGITMQPVTQSFAISQTPNCGNPRTFSFVQSPPTFVTLSNIAANSGSVQAIGATLSNQNVYALTLRAAVDAATVDASFQVEVSDPCKRAIFQAATPSPIANMSIIRDFDTTKTQTFSVTSDIQTDYGLVCNVSASLISPPAYVSITGTTITVDALLTTQTDAGLHTIQVRVDSAEYPASVTDATYSFTLDVQHCIVTVISIPTIADFYYTLNQGPTTKIFDAATWSSLACNYAVTYTATYSNSPVNQLSWLTFSGATQAFTFNATKKQEIGTYTITVTATIPQPSDASGVKEISTTFKLYVSADCLNTTLVDKIFNDMTVKVSLSSTQDITFEDTAAISHSQPTQCGARVYSFTGGLPSYLQLDASQTTLTLSTMNVVDAGTHSVQFSVSLASFPGVPSITKTFQAIITCEVLTLTFTTQPANIFIEPGVTMQPVTQSFSISQTPNCGNPQTFSFVQSPPTFVTLQNIAVNSGSVQATGATLSNQNVYTLTLRAAVDAATVDASFQVEVSDPCKRAIFQAATPSPIANMSIIRDFDTTKTQTFSVTSDIQTDYSLVCNVSASLINPPAYVSITGTTITVDALLTTQTDAGLHTIQVRVDSAEYPASVTDATYSFTLDVQHCVVTVMSMPIILDTSHTLNSGPNPLSFSAATWSNFACNYAVTYTVAYVLNTETITQPSWITFSGANQSFTFNATQQLSVGVYTITVTASIPQPSDATGVKQVSVSFALTVINDCVNTTLTSTVIPDLVAKISLSATVQDIFVQDLKGNLWSNPLYCGQRSYSLAPQYPFATITGDKLTVQSTLPNDENVYNVVLTVSLADFPGVPQLNLPIKITIVCEVQKIDVVTAPAIASVYNILFDPAYTMPFKFNEFPQCGLTYRLSASKPFATVNNQLQSISISSQNLADAGTYKLELVADPAKQGVSKTVAFEVIMVHICANAQFFPNEIASVEVFKQDPSRTSTKQVQFNPFTYDVQKKFNIDCGNVRIKLLLHPGKLAAPQWIQVDEVKNKLNIDFSQVAMPQRVEVDMVAYLEDWPTRNITQSFNVTQSSSELACSAASPITFNYGDPPKTFSVKYSNETFVTSIKLTPVKTPFATNVLGFEQDLPSFARFDYHTSAFTISDVKKSDFGSYFIGLSISYAEYPGYSIRCKQKVDVGYEPAFIGDEISDQKITCGNTWSLKVPDYTDVFGYQAKVIVDLANSAQFLVYDAATHIITTEDPDTSQLAIGSFKIKVLLTDSLQKTVENTIKIDVTCFLGYQIDTTVKATPFQPQIQTDPPKPFIQSVNQLGLVRVGFSKAISLPTLEMYPEFKHEQFLRANCTNSTVDSQYCIKTTARRQLNQKQKNKEKEAIEIVNRGLSLVNNTFVPIINLIMKPGPETDSKMLDFTWNCTDFKPTYIDFSVNYTNYQEVSIRDYKDSLEVAFNAPQYFRSADNNEYIEVGMLPLEKVVPVQLDPSQAATLAAATAAVGKASKAVVVANMAMNIFLGGALQELFSAMRKLTIMVHLLIINVKIPANAQYFFSGLLSFVTFNLIDLTPYIRNGLNLFDDELLNQNFQSLGYSSNYFVINMGNLLIVMAYMILLLIFYASTQNVKHQKFMHYRGVLVQGLIWNKVISFVNEGYMLLSISCITNFLKFRFDSIGTIVSSNTTIIAVFVLVGFPIFSFAFLLKKRANLHTKKFKDRYEALYEGLNYKRGHAIVLAEPAISFARILILTSSLILLQNYRYFQLFVSIFSMTFIIIYTGLAKPYNERSQSFFQTFNECFVAIMTYHLMCFADFIQDEPTRNLMGWSMIASISLNLVTNVAFIIFGAIKESYLKYRRKYYEYRLKKLRKLADERASLLLAIELDVENQLQEEFAEDEKKNSFVKSGTDYPIEDDFLRGEPIQAKLLTRPPIPDRSRRKKKLDKCKSLGIRAKPVPVSRFDCILEAHSSREVSPAGKAIQEYHNADFNSPFVQAIQDSDQRTNSVENELQFVKQSSAALIRADESKGNLQLDGQRYYPSEQDIHRRPVARQIHRNQLMETYRQNSSEREREDPLEHESRVTARQRRINLIVGEPNQMRQLFDEIWRPHIEDEN